MDEIGIIKSPYTELANMPVQPRGAAGVEGEVVVFPKYEQGLADLEGFSHIYLIYLFHQATRVEMTVIPFLDTAKRGVFSTRSPLRPNHIGLSIVELVKREGCMLTVRGIDVLDGTPLIDIKPYIAAFDSVEKSRSGWLSADADEISKKRSDTRFI